MESIKKVYEYPPMNEIHRLDLVDSDEYLLAIHKNGPNNHFVGILHKPFNVWLKPVSLPRVQRSFVMKECHALPKPISFAIYFYDCSSYEHCMMFYSFSPSNNTVVLDRCVSLGRFSREYSTVLFAPDRGSIYLFSSEFLDIKEISMDDGNSAEIGNFITYPKHWMIYEHTIYAVHFAEISTLRVCAFDVQRREWGAERSHRIDSSKTSFIFGVCFRRNLFLICYQQYIFVFDVVTGGRRYVDIRHLALPENYLAIIDTETMSIYFLMLESGELILLSGHCFRNKPWSEAPYETRLRVVAAFEPQNLSEIARRAVHESMPAETWKALRNSPLGDTVCLVKNLFTLIKPEKSLKRKWE